MVERPRAEGGRGCHVQHCSLTVSGQYLLERSHSPWKEETKKELDTDNNFHVQF